MPSRFASKSDSLRPVSPGVYAAFGKCELLQEEWQVIANTASG